MAKIFHSGVSSEPMKIPCIFFESRSRSERNAVFRARFASELSEPFSFPHSVLRSSINSLKELEQRAMQRVVRTTKQICTPALRYITSNFTARHSRLFWTQWGGVESELILCSLICSKDFWNQSGSAKAVLQSFETPQTSTKVPNDLKAALLCWNKTKLYSPLPGVSGFDWQRLD